MGRLSLHWEIMDAKNAGQLSKREYLKRGGLVLALIHLILHEEVKSLPILYLPTPAGLKLYRKKSPGFFYFQSLKGDPGANDGIVHCGGGF